MYYCVLCGKTNVPYIFALMNIGFDAKRAYHNTTGLGHYSRTLIRSLADYHPDHSYYLFNPSPSKLFEFRNNNIHEIRPVHLIDRLFPAVWRSSRVTNSLKNYRLDIYHGLSHELPLGLQDTGIPGVVTIHDLIHERFPEQYNAIDVKIYQRKFRYACKHATKVIAISKQTRQDIIAYYGTDPGKIEVCYQSCNPSFARVVDNEEKARVRHKYSLPAKYFLYVGSLIERKNLLNICKAIFLLRYEMDIPLVVIGDGGKYKQLVKDFVRQNGLEKKILFVSESREAKVSRAFQTAADFPAIYQSAIALIYPSFFEGFGIPVLEALWSRLPVITSNTSSLPEAGGEGAAYVNPNNAEEIASAMKRIYTDTDYSKELVTRGWDHAQLFTQQLCADRVMNVYSSLFLPHRAHSTHSHT
jgi:glycosyltransferase involved in cell wall biosynthesis